MVKTINRAASVLGLVLCCVMAYSFWRAGLFDSREALTSYIGQFGWAGPVVFMAFQAVQVVIPILPGGLGCLAGVILFGAWQGFWYNYIGICVGSLAAFAIARACGRPLLESLFPPKMIEKYDRWMGTGNRFARWFAFLIFIPVAPDDYLCFLAGTTRIDWRLYTAIIFLCKPAAIALYSLGLTVVAQNVLGLWR
ncbi:TVP38/TMEM64 family protein [Subdoligranulum variabile]|uniref:TVP38/TMEM64 family membrane protein n=1 Tax=Subdoligranulum variabile DSM 15176 TaxID=411471 RepID=D1PIS5_9FIRM|nr:VTT domain-containing protein [Subdoligranulum variabile]EFB77434.1 SNARE-like domain protein [Subdoligranulum variabile DSM 15176]UWP67323.1 VTT domain-containing protein [Subdoligranulum variabile]